MTLDHTKPIKPSTIVADRESVAAVQAIADYAPPNSDYSVQSLLEAQAELDAKLIALAQAEALFKAARDQAVASAHRFHNKVIGMRDSIGAQFGKASNEFQSVGRKKITEYRRPTRRARKPKAD